MVKIEPKLIHDTIKVPGTVVYLSDTIPCPPAINFKKEIKQGRVTATVKIENGKLTVSCKEDSLQSVVDRMVYEKTITKQSNRTVHKPVETPIPFRYEFYRRGFWILLFILLINIVWKVVKLKTGKLW